MPVLPQVEKSLEMTAPPNWGKFKMTVFHQIEKSFKNECVPPNWDHILEMTVLQQIENILEMTLQHQIENSLEMTVLHQIE